MLEVVHVVRRYGPVGGMERYVWELTHALSKLGVNVMVVCEKCFAAPESNIKVVELGEVRPKPRWLAMLRFSSNVRKWHESLGKDCLIHSHERTGIHQITTIHGPSIKNRKKKTLDFLSIRIQVWEWLERREMLGRQVLRILPNSALVKADLIKHYPEVVTHLGPIAHPGVTVSKEAPLRNVESKTIGFIGKEWKRKGLPQAIEVFEEIYRSDPSARFLVAGAEVEEVQPLFIGLPEGSYDLLGWVEPSEFFGKINTLIHPAKDEPFGMVIAEALEFGVPVVISDVCGVASHLNEQHCYILPLDSNAWGESVSILLNNTARLVEGLGLTWDGLALETISLYKTIAKD